LKSNGGGIIAVGKNTYNLSDPTVQKEFARLKPLLAGGGEIEIHGCNVAANVDLNPKTREALKNLPRVTGAYIGASPEIQYPLRPGAFAGQVVRFKP